MIPRQRPRNLLLECFHQPMHRFVSEPIGSAVIIAEAHMRVIKADTVTELGKMTIFIRLNVVVDRFELLFFTFCFT